MPPISPELLKLLALLLKHTGELPNIIVKLESAGSAITTHGVEFIDPTCDLLQAFKPLEADLIAGGFKAEHHTEHSLRAAYAAAGQEGLLQRLLAAFANNPALLALLLKLFGLAV